VDFSEKSTGATERKGGFRPPRVWRGGKGHCSNAGESHPHAQNKGGEAEEKSILRPRNEIGGGRGPRRPLILKSKKKIGRSRQEGRRETFPAPKDKKSK